MGFARVCGLDDLWEGEMESYVVDGQEILILRNDGGAMRAFQGVCPHQDFPLIEGKFDGRLLVCRAHQWMFDTSTGHGVNPSNCQLAEYPLKIDGDDVLVDAEGVSPLFAGA
ncbi:MAG: Rieske 2Fe-2S domain-containing protein [Ilumatobacteraceae bacterium]